MRGLGRLILVGDGFFSRSTNTYNLAAAAASISRRRRINSSSYSYANSNARAKAFRRSSHLFSLSHLSQFGGYIQSTRYHTEIAEGPEFTNNGKALEKGDTINLNDLLFSPTRDYLVKNNNQHVKAEELKGKVVILYFMPLSGHYILHNNKDAFTSELKDVYNDLLPLNNFEVVLVVQDDHCKGQIPVSSTTDPQEEFEALFSPMPWPAIPFSDAGSRKHIEKRLFKHGEYAPPVMFVIDSTGLVLQTRHAWDILLDFGALGFPFSDDRINFLRAEDDAVAKNPSLNTLLASPQRSYVISNQGNKVPIDAMKDKVVALYFYYVDRPDHYLTSKLQCVCDMLAKLKK